MKNKTLLLFLLSLIGITNLTVAQDIQWEKTLGGQHADYLMDAIPTADYGFILAGSSLSQKTGNKSSDNKGDLDYWVWKMKENGELDWQKSFGGSGADFLQSIDNTRDGGFILGGVSFSNQSNDKTEDSKGGDDFWIVKLNAAGNEEWQKTIGGSSQEKLQIIKQTQDGGYIIGGSSSSDISGDKLTESFGGMDYWIVKLDKTGKIVWQKSFGGIYFDELRSLEPTIDGGYILGGYSNSSASGSKTQDNKGTGDYWIIKIDSKGVEQWQKTIGGNSDDQLSAVHQCFDGNYIIGGNSNSVKSEQKTNDNQNGTDFWVLKLDQTGEILWQNTYDIDKLDILTSLVENKDHSILLCGYSQGQMVNAKLQKSKKTDTEGVNDFVTIKISENGKEIWNKILVKDGQEILKKAIETRDGGYLLAGINNINNNDFYIVKVKDKNKQEVVKTMIEAFPNPATTYTNIIIGYEYTNGRASLYDLAGRQLQQFEITSRTVPIDMTSFPEGIYIVNIETDKGKDGIKIIKQDIKN